MRSVRFIPGTGAIVITTDQKDIIEILLGGLEMKIEDAAKDGRYKDCQELITVYLDLEGGLELIEDKEKGYGKITVTKQEVKQDDQD